MLSASTKVPGLNGLIVVLTPDFSIKMAIDVTRQPILPTVLLVFPILTLAQLGSPCRQLTYSPEPLLPYITPPHKLAYLSLDNSAN